MSDNAIGNLAIISWSALVLGIGITYGVGPTLIAIGVLLSLIAVVAAK